MKIKQIKVRNFRLLKDFTIDLQPDLSLIVGKNNVGKTSLLLALDKFINYGDSSKKIRYNDFNIDFQKEIEGLFEQAPVDGEHYIAKSISLRIIAEYYNEDPLDNIGNKILTNLVSGNNFFALGFDYMLDFDGYTRMLADYQTEKEKFDENHQKVEPKPEFDTREFLNDHFDKYFHIERRSIEVDKDTMDLVEAKYVNLNNVQGFKLDDVINFQYISARRRVDNRDVNNTLSGQTSELYNAQDESKENEEARSNFIAHLKDTDLQLNGLYDKIFDSIIQKVAKLGGMRSQETVIKVISTLQHRELLKGNTTVVYEHDNRNLPENYNGLGYMNLISIIFDISLSVEKMKRAAKRRPADINLLFIEEPEAHTHPQMQYVFIKNIKDLLKDGVVREDGANATLQYIVSTHSSHIVSDSDFDDIKYIKRVEGQNAVESKNLKDLKELYGDDEKASYRFLKQYLTLMNSELFFADKAIFVEGDTERILMPVMMQKVDEETPPNLENGELGLLSQNISVLPIGAHSHIFEKFFHFIGLTKLLVITDMDVCEYAGYHSKCRYAAGNNQITSNKALRYYFDTNDVDVLIAKNQNEKFLKWNEGEAKMIADVNGNMMVCYQTNEGGYQARSFEDCFFQKNADFICNSSIEDALLQPAFETFKENRDPFQLAENGVKSKATLAISLLLAEDDANQWKVPEYIKEGLLWMRS